MASSASGQDESNLALCIGYPGGQDGTILPARDGLPAVSRKRNFPKSHIMNPSLTKLVRSRWLDLGLVRPFLRVMDLDSTDLGP